MNRRELLISLPGLPAVLVAARAAAQEGPSLDPREVRLRNLRQLTFGGQNAEAYFSPGRSRLIFQSTRDGRACDQIYTMDLDGGNVRIVSTGRGVTTCSFFFPGGRHFIFSSMHGAGPDCPPRPDMSRGYVWALYPEYHIFRGSLDGGPFVQLTTGGKYNAEGAISPDGSKIVFTSHREGDLDLYLMDSDGSNVRRLTSEYGYDGGPFFSWSGRYIVYRSFHPRTEGERRDYAENFPRNIFRPTWLEIFLMNADGTGKRQVTDLKAASFAPFMHPNDRQIIFSSNLHNPSGRFFALYLVNTDGTGLERVTYAETLASFPMFSPDGRRLVFASSRHARGPREFNIFLADWAA
jgi:Tol biopolymer transport system component